MKRALLLGLLSATNILVAFLFQWYVLTYFGPGPETDALFAGMTVPQLILAVVSSSLTHVLVPIFAGESKAQIQHDMWGFLYLVSTVFGILTIGLYLSAEWWVPISVPGFPSDSKILTVELTQIQLIGVVFSAANSVQWAAYHAKGQYKRVEAVSLVSSLVGLITLVWLLPIYGVTVAAWVNVFKGVFQTLLLSLGAGRPVWPNFKTDSISIAWSRVKPLLLGTSYFKTDPFIDRFLLSSAASGSMSLYYLAQQLYGAFGQVINKALITVMVVHLGKFHKQKRPAAYHSFYLRRLWQVGLLSSVGFVALGVLGQWGLNLLVGHGNFNQEKVIDLWWIMMWLGGLLIGGVMGQVVSSAFYASGDTKTPVQVSVLSFTVYIPMKILAYYYYGVSGLCIVTSVYYMANLMMQIGFFELKRG